MVAGLGGVLQSVGPHANVPQMREWGFNLLVPPMAEGFAHRGLPHVTSLDLRRAGEMLLRGGGVQVPDVFDPRWRAAVTARVEALVPTASCAAYLADDELQWGAVPEAEVSAPLVRPALLQVCLSLDPVHAAYHAAWEFVLAPRPGGLPQLVRDWGAGWANKEALRQLTRNDEVIDGPAYRVDAERFLREFAQRYHRTVAEVLRRADPGRLLLSAPLGPTTAAVVRDAAAAHTDVLLVAAAGAGGGRGPELVWRWQPTDADLAAAARGPAVEWSDLERMLQVRRELLGQLWRNPQVVGYTWPRHVGGDLERDGPLQCALLDENGRVNHVHTAPLTALHAAAAVWRAAG